jgi:hypothetical protein
VHEQIGVDGSPVSAGLERCSPLPEGADHEGARVDLRHASARELDVPQGR